uniref:Ciliary microtubule inner protein 2C n=1 Tax=Catagonus wagneri TaxID=51154 RepID=A0A8C3WN28_9CETA
MASRSAGTLLTEFKAAYVPPGLMPGHQGHAPAALSCGPTHCATALRYFQDRCITALEQSHTHCSHFPTLFSPDPSLVLSDRSHTWDRWLHAPRSTRFNLDSGRSAELSRFYQMAQQHREYYRDKTGTVRRVPYFVLPMREWERYPIPTDLPPLSPKKKWHLLRVAPENLRTYQTFPSGKRVSPQERQRRDRYFEFRA